MKVVIAVEDEILIHSNPVLVISKGLLNEINQKIKSSKKELGGILIGYKLKGYNEYRIVEVTFPFSQDISEDFYFVRKDEQHNIFLVDKHIEDNSLTYLGDWHSHPNNSSIPSRIDVDTYNEHTRDSKTSSRLLFYITIGYDVNIQVYSFISKKKIKSAILELKK